MKTAARFTRRRQSSQEPLKLKNRAGPYPSGAVFLRMKKRRGKIPLAFGSGFGYAASEAGSSGSAIAADMSSCSNSAWLYGSSMGTTTPRLSSSISVLPSVQ